MAKKDNRALLEQFKETKKLLWKEGRKGSRQYEFLDRIEELPDERRFFNVYFCEQRDGSIHMRRIVYKRQKYLCVGGPLAGKREIEADAEGYVVYNCAEYDKGLRDTSIPHAILVHKSVLK